MVGEKKPIEQYQHKGKERCYNPPVGLVTPETDKDEEKKLYEYDPHLDPQLWWAGKMAHMKFEVPTVSLHVHRREMLLTTGVAVLSSSVFPLRWVAAQGQRKPRILYFTKSGGFVHPVVHRQGQPLAYSEKAFTELGKQNGFEVECSQDSALFDGDLGKYDLLAFYTSGNPFKGRQMQNVLDAVSAGKPCMGFHAATDTWSKPAIDPFLAMLGGRFVCHGAPQKAKMKVTSPKFPGVEGLGDGFEMNEEWYVLNGFAKDLHVILVQETQGMHGAPYQRPAYPATWARLHGKGRVFYTSMGHYETVWTSPIFEKVVLGALSWALGHVTVDIRPNVAEVAPKAIR